ncbi:TolC family protein [Paradesertivirga mongoliensis]|uniref:TolC family protein n=1 Tax=Paradesertivirga mongoliensis TaxID=2100740 RepID=A0ABW4ZL68_9SPHI|nr:TolC family protein [Pedobacter mongoliensis]
MRFTILSILILLSSVTLKAQDAQQGKTFTFNLQECLEYAYQNNDSLKNAQLDIESAKYKVKETIGIGLPQISGTASLQDFLKIPTTLIPGEIFGEPGTFVPAKFGVKYQSSAGITLNQLLFNGSYLVGLQASKTFRELSEKNYNRTKAATTVAVTKAYYQVLVSNEQAQLLNANIAQLAQQLKETTELNKQGFVEKIDLDRLNVIYNNLVTTRENVLRSLLLANYMLRFQIGMPATDNLVVKDKIADIKIENDLSLVADTSAYKKRFEYSLLETQGKLNALNLKRIKSEYLPTLAAFGSSSYNYQADKFSELYDRKFPTTVIGLQLNVPIFSGFQRYHQVKQAEIEVRKSANVLNVVKNGLLLQQDAARINYQNSIQSLNNQRSNMTLAQEVLRVSRIKYQQGVGSSIEVTQAQTALEEAENNYIQALYNALINRVDLDNAYGRIQ